MRSSSTPHRPSSAQLCPVVFAPDTGQANIPLSKAGVSPSELQTEAYAAVPLVVADAHSAHVVDYGSQVADADVMPPREPVMRLSEFETA